MPPSLALRTVPSTTRPARQISTGIEVRIRFLFFFMRRLSAVRNTPDVTALTGSGDNRQGAGKQMDLPLSGKVALVTGATRAAGIGAAIARVLAGDGASLLLHAFRPYDRAQPWGVGVDEPERLARELSAHVDVAWVERDLMDPAAAPALIED